MRFISLSLISGKAIRSFHRFTIPLLISFCTAIVLLWITDHRENDAYFSELVRFVIVSSLALPAFIGMTTYCERYSVKMSLKLVYHAALLVLSLFYFLSLPETVNEISAARYVLLSIAAHLSVSFAPFLINSDVNGFWQYNKTLFLRILTSALYSSVLFGGLSLAILAIDNLFDIKIDDLTYLRLFILIAVVFNTWFFLSGIPKDFSGMEQDRSYPNGLRIFTQYVLLPLVSIYLLILYAYGSKILFTFIWPHGWVSYLVIGFSTAGILALLLVWPLRSQDEYKWIKAYARSFFMALFPLVVLLFSSIYLRISEYGITANRYFIIVLAIWLLGIAAYFLFSVKKNIKLIPLSLFFIALFSGYGPWSAFEVGVRDQKQRLTDLATSNGMFANGKIVPLSDTKTLSDSALVSMSDIVKYLIEFGGDRELNLLLGSSADSLFLGDNSYNKATKVMSFLGLEYKPYYSSTVNHGFSYSDNSINRPLKVEGYAYYFSYEFYDNNSRADKNIELGDSLKIVVGLDVEKCELNIKSEKVPVIIPLKPLINALYKRHSNTKYDTPAEDMLISFDEKGLKGKVMFRSLYGSFKLDRTVKEITSLKVDILCIEN